VQGLAQLLPFVIIAVIFWFLLIRPQRKRQQQLADTQRSVEIGDEVMLGAGIYGAVTDVDEDAMVLETSPGSRMRVARAAVVRNLSLEARRDHPTDVPPTDPPAQTDPTPDN
jgi:preprotein translocase subunit YajC